MTVGSLDIVEFVKEPLVNLCEFMNPVYGISALKRSCYSKYSGVGRIFERIVKVFRIVFVAYEAAGSLSYHAKSFLNGFLEVASNSHHFSDTLHAGADFAGDTFELGKVPARNLADYIVKGRFKEGRGCLGNGVFQLEKSVSKTQFGGNKGQRIAGSFGCQCGRTAQSGIYLNYSIVLSVRAERILHIAFSNDSYVTHYIDGRLAEEMEFFVGKCLGRSDDDAFSGMDSERVEILHIADCYAIVIFVPDYFIFYFFPKSSRSSVSMIDCTGVPRTETPFCSRIPLL